MTDMVSIQAQREELKERFLKASTEAGEGLLTAGVDHLVLIAANLPATLAWYTDVLGMRVTNIFPNRDDPTSTHVFLDMGGGNQLAFFDFPEHGDDPTARGIGSMHHVALKADPAQFTALLSRLDSLDISHSRSGDDKNSGSVYLRDPNNVLVEVTTGY